jgi:hypothetical protein
MQLLYSLNKDGGEEVVVDLELRILKSLSDILSNPYIYPSIKH